jgi:hypothetical protein
MELNKELNIDPITSKQDIPNRNISPEVTRVGDDIRRLAEVQLATPSFKNTNLPGTNFLNSLHASNTNNKIQTTKFDVGKEAFVELSDNTMISRFESYVPGMNNEEFLAQTQSTGEKWANGLSKFVTKTGVNVLGGTVGVVEGLINGISKGSLSAVYNSDFNKYLDDINTKLDYNLPNYYTEQEKDMNFFQKLGTANFIANDLLGGLSFLTGTIISEGLWAAATGGGSLVAAGLRGGLTRGIAKKLGAKEAMTAMNSVKSSGKEMLVGAAKTNFATLRAASMKSKKIVEGLNTARFLYTSAGFEGGVEARHYMKETMDEWQNTFEQQNGRKPTAIEEVSFKNSLTNSANGLFLSNVALVGSSNLAIIGKMFLNKAPTRAVSNNFFKKNFLGVGYNKGKDAGLKAIQANKYQKAFGRAYSVGRPMVTEGFVEEGGQAVMSTAANKYVLSAYDKDNVGDGLSLFEALGEGINYAYGTKEGLTEVGLGSLIGILGGGFASRFKFNDVSSARKQMEGSVEYINQFTRDNLIENLKFGARMRQTAIDAAEARAQGNMTNEVMSDDTAMIAVAERAYHYENAQETITDFDAAIDLIDVKELEKEYGFTAEEVDTWKAEKKSQFKNIIGEHTQNLQFAEAIVGDTPISGLEELEGVGEAGVSDLKGAVAYTLTMGKRADEFAQSIANQIKLTVAGELSLEDNIDAVTVNEVLRKVDAKKDKAYKAKKKKLDSTRYKLDKLTKSKVELDTYAASLKDVDARQRATAQAAELQQQIIELQTQEAQLASEKSLAFEALNIPQLTDEVVTEDMLDDQANKVNDLKTTIDKIMISDPRRGELLKKLHLEYQRAVGNTKSFDQLLKSLIDPRTKVATLSGWLGKIVNKRKTVKGNTADMFINIIQNYQKETGLGGALWQQRNDIEKDKVINEIIKTDPNVNREDLQGKSLESLIEQLKKVGQEETNDPTKVTPEDITEEEVGNTSTESPLKNVKNTVEALKNRIKDIIKRNAYTDLVYEGSTFDYEGAKPNQKDMDRYTELLKKFTGKNINVLLKRPFSAKKPRGLTEAETNELQELNAKLNNWKILSGLQDTNNDSVADMLQLINQLETDYELTPTKIDIPTTELPTSDEVEGRMSANPLNTVVSPDVVMAKKDKKTNSYQFSHIKPTSLAGLFQGAKLYLVKGNKNVDVNSIPKKELSDAQVTKGNKFVLTTADGTDLVFEVVDRQRLSVSTEALEKAMEADDTTKIVPYGRSNFMVVYTKAGEEYVPLQGDFVEASINDNEVIVLDSQRMNELPEGTPLRTVVNLNETFNAKLIQDFKDGKINKEELINNIKVYLSPEGSVNKPVGFLRAILEDSSTNSESYARLHLIRKQAVEAALKFKTARVEVGITIPFKRTIPGAPNMNVKVQDGKLVASGVPITQEALSAVEDYGYVLNGVPHTKNGLSLDNKEVITIFATALSNRAENRNVKIPIVVFESKGKKYAFPVSLKDRGGNKGAQVLEIINNQQDSDLAKIVKLNELMLENNIDPRKYNITSMESPQLLEVFDLFNRTEEGSQIRDVVDVETWLEESHNKTTLLNSVEIGIDITDNPFHAPKGILDLQGMRLPTEADLKITAIENLDKLGKQINSMFAKDNPFANMTDNSEFFDAWEEVGIDGYIERDFQRGWLSMREANANIVMEAFSKNIPRDVRRVLGNEMIGEVREAIKEFQLIKNGLKPTISFVNEEGSETIQEQENKCN